MRVEAAFAGRKVKAWPFRGPVVVEERSPASDAREAFIVDNWCLIASGRFADGAERFEARPSQRFDYDTYKILLRFITDRAHQRLVRTVPREMLVQFDGEG